MSDDGWIESAISDDSIVAEFLIRLRNSSSSAVVASLGWGAKRSRSRHMSRSHHALKKKGDSSSARASPTTPLSWSAGTSYSGSEESTHPSIGRSTSSRSKATFTSELENKLAGKKKKFAELQEEESFLTREKRDLRRLDLPSQSGGKAVLMDVWEKPNYDLSHSGVAVNIDHRSTILQTSGKSGEGNALICSSSQPVHSCKNTATRELLPDLNMLPDLNLPLEDDSSSEILYGMS